MRAVGLITEYNPFHRGHEHHLRESLRLTGAQVSVAVMSGHFLQRGEPALVDKWVRAETALRAGVDLVVELPFPWACNSAPHFARGAVAVLNSFGKSMQALCFGSESGNLVQLRQAEAALERDRQGLEKDIRRRLGQGENYPRARAASVRQSGLQEDVAEVLSHPNNILGIEYLRALKESDSTAQAYTVPRIGGGFHDLQPGTHDIASATAIRHRLRQGRNVATFLPQATHTPLFAALARGATPDRERLLTLLLGRLLQGAQAVKPFYLVEGGIENRLAAAAEVCSDCDELVSAVKSRHFTRTRVTRMLSHVLLGVERQWMEESLATGPLFITLLGASARGRRYLAHCRKDLQLPLIQNFSRVHAQLKRRYGRETFLSGAALQQLDLQLLATRYYTLLQEKWPGGPRGRDYFQPPCMLP